ncbi:hypothetical protein Nepgr_015998 [Nepenthes gracilis]|uniref:Uncharacterized protein n=1 Tax=Nepenthes gracilis TaxID=150966 RepID=A0AAD3XQW4_NEPGR|nr:hypothetical protein Nepgr_015998 [Nepenthes gracilis]
MAMRNFFNEIKGLKLKEVPDRVKPMLSINYLKGAIERGLDNYHKKSAATSSTSSTLRNTVVTDCCPHFHRWNSTKFDSPEFCRCGQLLCYCSCWSHLKMYCCTALTDGIKFVRALLIIVIL